MAVAQKSTIGRSIQFGALRLGLSLAGSIAPPLAARAAERLFLTPPRHAPPPREQEALARAQPFAVPFGRGWLHCWRFGEGPAVLLVHGWGGRGGQMTSLVPSLEARGLSAITFDGPAHGGSSGRIASVPHFAEAVAVVADHVVARAAVGHSMGAAGLALAVVRGLRLDAAAFLAPPRSPAAFVTQFCDQMGLAAPVEARVRALLARRLGIAVEDLDLPRMVGAVDVPLVVLHDRDDREVPWEDGAATAAAWPGARLVSTRGLGHRRILRDAEVTSQVADFLALRLRPVRATAA